MYDITSDSVITLDMSNWVFCIVGYNILHGVVCILHFFFLNVVGHIYCMHTENVLYRAQHAQCVLTVLVCYSAHS